jgi:hypothetical protein
MNKISNNILKIAKEIISMDEIDGIFDAWKEKIRKRAELLLKQLSPLVSPNYTIHYQQPTR